MKGWPAAPAITGAEAGLQRGGMTGQTAGGWKCLVLKPTSPHPVSSASTKRNDGGCLAALTALNLNSAARDAMTRRQQEVVAVGMRAGGRTKPTRLGEEGRREGPLERCRDVPMLWPCGPWRALAARVEIEPYRAFQTMSQTVSGGG
eukprot:COSAG01_NODE_1357_length_10597_cov_2.476948_4_plen_147_part_00